MALMFFDGFDQRYVYGSRWTSGSVSTTAGRYDGYARRVSGSSNEPTLAFPPATTVIVGFAFACSTPAANGHILKLFTTSGETYYGQFSLTLDANLHLSLRREVSNNSTTPLATSTQPYPADNAWRYVEVRVTNDDVAGRAVVRVNGEIWLDYTGDTRQNTDTQWSKLRLCDAGSYTSYDDFYLCDDTGTTHNDFLGDLKVETLVPTGPGEFNEWVGSDGDSIDNHLLHADTYNNTNYVETNASAARELYAFQPTLASGDVHAIALNLDAHKSQVGFASARPLTRATDGTITGGDTVPLSDTVTTLSTPATFTDPSGAPWTAASLAATQFGVERV